MYISLYSDMDECIDGTHNCAQICINTIGSFTCDCDDGYELDSDEVMCNGMYKTCMLTALKLIIIIIIIIITNIQTCIYSTGHKKVNVL